MKNFLWKIRAVPGIILCCAAASHASPSFFMYQGRYLNSGVPSNGNTPLEFRVTNGGSIGCGLAGNPVAGPIFWTSGSTSVFTVNGLFSYRIGNQKDGATPDPNFALINWNSGVYYLDVCANGVELTPPDLIGSSPFSLYASTAGLALNVGPALFLNPSTWNAPETFNDEVTIATEAIFSAGRLNLAGNPIVNVPNPSGSNDAANKTYVDAAAASAVSIATNSVAAGGASAATHTFHNYIASQTFSGEVIIATEAYFSAGRLNLGGQAIVNVPAPVNPGDAATKIYVDAATAATKNYVDAATANVVSVLAPQVVPLTYGSFGGSAPTLNTLLSGTRNMDVIVDLSNDHAGGNQFNINLPAATVGQNITIVVVAGPTAVSIDTVTAIGAINGGFPSCAVSGLTSAGPGGSSASWLGLIGYLGGWACYTK